MLSRPDRHSVHLTIPIDDVAISDDGRHRIMLDGRPRVVAFHVDLGTWFLVAPSTEPPYGHVLSAPVLRTAPGRWQRGTHTNELTRSAATAARARLVTLPPRIEIPEQYSAVPRRLHFIWLGNAPIPEILTQRVRQNARYCPGFKVRLYIDATDPVARRQLTTQFPADTRVELADLRDDAHFQAFLQSPLGTFYQRFTDPDGPNFGAASDILRTYLLHRDGGLYMDVDDVITQPIPVERELLAGPSDLLLNRMVTIREYGFHGYPNSNIACHAGNPILAALLVEMTRRLANETALWHTPHPWKAQATKHTRLDQAAMLAYIVKIFALTGPQVFNDVLQQMRPDYYFIERDLLRAYRCVTVTPDEPRYVANAYFDAMHAAKAYYLPFAEPDFDIEIGSAHSWNRSIDHAD